MVIFETDFFLQRSYLQRLFCNGHISNGHNSNGYIFQLAIIPSSPLSHLPPCYSSPSLPSSATTRPVPPSLTAPPPGQTPVAAGAEPPSTLGLPPPAPSLMPGVRGQLQCRPTSHHAGPFLLSPLMRRLQGSLRRSAPAGRASLPPSRFHRGRVDPHEGRDVPADPRVACAYELLAASFSAGMSPGGAGRGLPLSPPLSLSLKSTSMACGSAGIGAQDHEERMRTWREISVPAREIEPAAAAARG